MSRLAASRPNGLLLWKGYALVALALTAAYFFLAGHAGAQSAIYQLFVFAAPVAIIAGVRRYRPDSHRHWHLFAGGLVLWGIGDLYWDSYEWFLGKQAPYPSFADIAYLAAYPLFLAGILVLVRGWGRPRIANMLDAAIVALAAGILSTLFLLTPLVTTSEPLFAKSIAVAFPVMDFLMLVGLMQLMFRRRKVNFALRTIMVGTAALLISDSAYSYLGLESAYTSGMFIDVGWLACYGLWGIAALHPSMARIQSLPEHEAAGLSIWRISALFLALLAAPVVLIVQTLTGHTIETGAIGAVIVATMVLVATRVWLLQRDARNVQAQLADSNERLHFAHQVAGVSTWDMDLVSDKLTLSDDLSQLIAGCSPAEARIEDWVAFIHPDDREHVTKNFDHFRTRGGDFEIEYRFCSPDGTEGWVFSRGRVLMENGAPVRAVGVAVDVTDRHAIEEQMERSKEGFHMAEEAANVGTWDLDLTTGALAWSDSLRRMMGVTPEVPPTYEAFIEWIHPDDRDRVQRVISEAHERGTEFEVEYRSRHMRDGREEWIESRGRGVLDAAGKPGRSVGVALDISKHHAMQELLARSEEGMRLAQELGGVGTWDTDLSTRATTWSANLRRLAGVGDDVMASRESFTALVHPEDRAEFQAAMAAAVDEGGHLDLEFRLVRPNDGELRWMLTRGDAVTGPDGSPLRFVGFLLDITERRAAEEHQEKLEHQLRHAHKLEAVGRLAGGVAHDFNNILLAIRGNGELALDALKEGADPLEEVEEMVAAAERAAALTAQLLAFSRRQVLQAEVLDLNDIVGDMDKLLRRMIGEDVALHSIASTEPVRVSADRSQIEQVIANLAVNGRDAMPDGGVLTLEVMTTQIGSTEQVDLAPGRYAMLSVSDTGGGMDSETVAKIFEPFFTTKEEGTGFGLSTVHGIVVQSGGSIWVYSEVGHGTTFKVFLPLAEQAAAEESAAPRHVASLTASAGETILLVEDDAHVQRIVGNILRRSGYRVLAASGAEEALQLAEADNDTIHLLLSDLIMPGTSGRELAEQIQVLRPDISVLYMSGYTDDAVIRRGVLEAGMAFIQKPFGGEDLRRRVRDALDDQDRMEAA